MTQTEQPIKTPGFGILSVHTDMLADLLHLPEGYSIVGLNVNPLKRQLELTLMSYDLPTISEGDAFPLLNMVVTRHISPDDPQYRYITTTIEVAI